MAGWGTRSPGGIVLGIPSLPVVQMVWLSSKYACFLVVGGDALCLLLTSFLDTKLIYGGGKGNYWNLNNEYVCFFILCQFLLLVFGSPVIGHMHIHCDNAVPISCLKSLFLITLFTSKSAFRATLDFLHFCFSLSAAFSSSLFLFSYLHLKYVSCKGYAVGSYFLTYSDNF